MHHNVRGALLSLLAFAIYASTDVIVKFLGGVYSPVQTIFFSTLFSFPLAVLMIMRDPEPGTLRPKHPWWALARAVATLGSGISGFYAFSVLELTQTYTILFTMPLLITVMAVPVLGERVHWRRGAAVLVGLGGVVVALQPGQTELGLGHLAALVAAVCSATASVIVRKIGADERPVVIMLYPMMANFVVMGAALGFVYQPMPVEHIGLLALMAILGSAAGLIIIAAYKSAVAIVVAPMQYSQIIWATIFGLAVFQESPNIHTLYGAAIIIASGVYIVLREEKSGSKSKRPVLQTRSRAETGINLRIGPLLDRMRDENSDK